jgi:hypothetical protein
MIFIILGAILGFVFPLLFANKDWKNAIGVAYHMVYCGGMAWIFSRCHLCNFSLWSIYMSHVKHDVKQSK